MGNASCGRSVLTSSRKAWKRACCHTLFVPGGRVASFLKAILDLTYPRPYRQQKPAEAGPWSYKDEASVLHCHEYAVLKIKVAVAVNPLLADEFRRDGFMNLARSAPGFSDGVLRHSDA